MTTVGVLSTAGGLVVQGSIDGYLRFFDDKTGEVLKEIDTGTSLIAAPMSYTVDGVQYIAILAGTGGGGWNMWTPDKIAVRARQRQSRPGIPARWRRHAHSAGTAAAGAGPRAHRPAGHGCGYRGRCGAVCHQLRQLPRKLPALTGA